VLVAPPGPLAFTGPRIPALPRVTDRGNPAARCRHFRTVLGSTPSLAATCAVGTPAAVNRTASSRRATVSSGLGRPASRSNASTTDSSSSATSSAAACASCGDSPSAEICRAAYDATAPATSSVVTA